MDIEDIPRKQETTKRIVCFVDESNPNVLHVNVACQNFASASETSTHLFNLDLGDMTQCARTLQAVLPVFRDAGHAHAQQDFRDFLRLDELYERKDD